MTNFSYYIGRTYRRKIIDNLQFKYCHLYNGIVLDIGGRDRGKFQSPKNSVTKWITTDIEACRNTDLTMDVANMEQIQTESINVVNAIELFEHVEEIEKGISECHRVLKNEGFLIISAPFLYPIHADPNDFQRWTDTKWRNELKKAGFKLRKLERMGYYFTVLADILKTPIISSRSPFRYIGWILFPFLDIIASFDKLFKLKSHPIFGKYTTGYFIIAKKI